MSNEEIRVVIADDEPGMRMIMRKMIEKAGGFMLCGEADNGPDLLKLVEQYKPQVCFLDVEMPGMTGLECAKAIQDTDPRTILVFATAHEDYMAQGIFRAYWVGGVICALGQTINDLFAYGLKWGAQSASTATSICLIFASSLLTGLGVYDKIGKYAGAGSIVPITGFANSVVSPAMEFRREGLVMGVGAKLFTLAGPVLTYGIGGSIVVGLAALAMGAGR